jgi:hypothetical protein
LEPEALAESEDFGDVSEVGEVRVVSDDEEAGGLDIFDLSGLGVGI